MNREKVLAIGDSHGTKNWKRFDFEKYSKIIFLGDFFDTWENNWEECNQIDNLNEILELQRKDQKKYNILLGNHDMQYIDLNEEYSGKQHDRQYDIHNFLLEHIKEFKIVYQIKDYIFSHAGLSSPWGNFWEINKNNDIDIINNIFYDNIFYPFCFNRQDFSCCGNNKYQGPLWIRPQALCEYPWKNYNQVVGHTSNRGPNGVAEFEMKNGKKLIVVDNQEHTAYLEIEI